MEPGSHPWGLEGPGGKVVGGLGGLWLRHRIAKARDVPIPMIGTARSKNTGSTGGARRIAGQFMHAAGFSWKNGPETFPVAGSAAQYSCSEHSLNVCANVTFQQGASHKKP